MNKILVPGIAYCSASQYLYLLLPMASATRPQACHLRPQRKRASVLGPVASFFQEKQNALSRCCLSPISSCTLPFVCLKKKNPTRTEERERKKRQGSHLGIRKIVLGGESVCPYPIQCPRLLAFPCDFPSIPAIGPLG